MTDALAPRPADRTADTAPSRREQAAALGATRRWLFLVGTALGLLAPWALWASGLSTLLWTALRALPAWVGLPLQVAALTLLLALISTPLSFYGGFVVKHRYGLSTQTLGGWLVDWLKSTLLMLVLTTAAAVLFYASVWAAPMLWWLLFWLAALTAVILLTFLTPYVLVPLFFKPTPVDDPGLVLMIEDLARRAGTSVAGVSRLDFSRRTHEANAAVIGFGRSRRVVLADTLLATFTPSEIRSVVAHELGHHVHRDIARLMVVQAIVMLVGLSMAALAGDAVLGLLGAAPLADPSSYPLLVLGVAAYGLICLPILNAISRAIEAEADRFAVGLVGEGRSFAAAMRRLADQNLAEERPPRWAELLLYSHPPIWRRIERAEAAHHV